MTQIYTMLRDGDYYIPTVRVEEGGIKRVCFHRHKEERQARRCLVRVCKTAVEHRHFWEGIGYTHFHLEGEVKHGHYGSVYGGVIGNLEEQQASAMRGPAERPEEARQ